MDREEESATSWGAALGDEPEEQRDESAAAMPRAPKASTRPQQTTGAAPRPVDVLTQHYALHTNDAATAQQFRAPRAMDERAGQQEARKNIHPDSYDNAIEQRDHPRYHANAAHGWEQGPTGFVGFDQYFGSNAGAVNAQADALRDRVKGTADAARGKLADAQQGFRDDVNRASVFTSVGNPWDESIGLDTGALAGDFTQAQDEMGALGMGAGGVSALTGSTGSGFNSMLTAAAGQPQFDKLREQYGDLDTALADAGTQAQQYENDAKSAAEASYENATDAMRQRQAEDAADPYLQMAQAAGYASVDEMLTDGYEAAKAQQGFEGTFEDYKRSWLAQQGQLRDQTAAEG